MSTSLMVIGLLMALDSGKSAITAPYPLEHV
jgi:hypothetical protein